MTTLEEPATASRRFLRYTLAVAAGLIVLAGIGVGAIVARATPILKHRLIAEINDRFDGQAELGALQVDVFPELRVTGDNLIVRDRDLPDHPIVLTVRHFSLHAGLAGLWKHPIRVGTVHLEGLSVIVPPRKSVRPQNAEPTDSGERQSAFVIDQIVSDDAHLEILTDQRGKLPLAFDIQNLVLNSAGPGQAMPFSAKLTNPKPSGLISTKGEFGPWNNIEPRDTPVSGTYSFTKADLSTIKGIGGTLKSIGEFKGKLSRIEVDGETQTPDFFVSTGGHPMPLDTTFSATVDGATGDTFLHPVQATLDHSLLIANGSVVHERDGHRIILNVVATNARIEDLLKIAVKTDPPSLFGPVSLHTKFVLPPGPGIVPERLKLDGSFSLPAAHFSNASAQEKLDRLSVRAEARPQELKLEDIPDVLSKMSGDFKLNQGVVSFSMLNFEVPGASIALAGDYQLEGREFSFEGKARLQAKLSQMTTGIKSFFLKAVDPFFAKDGAGTLLPIRITGTGTSPKVALDFGHPKRDSPSH